MQHNYFSWNESNYKSEIELENQMINVFVRHEISSGKVIFA